MEITQDIRKIYEKYILKDVEDFCLDDYSKFEEEIWGLKEKYKLENSPFLLFPEPAEEADREMMNKTNAGLTEPDNDAKKNYLEKMKISYGKI